MAPSEITMTVSMRGLGFVRPVSTVAVWLMPIIGKGGAVAFVNTVLPWLVWWRVEHGRWQRFSGPFVEVTV